MDTEPLRGHSRRPPPLTLLLRGFAAGLLLLLLALSIRIHRGALSGEPTALASSSGLAAASSAFTRTANRASEAASDTFVPERFTPPSGLPPGTTCEYLPPWLEAAMNSMVAKAVQLVTRYPTLSHLPIDAKVRVGLIDYDVRNITIVDLSLSQIRMGACRKPNVLTDGATAAQQAAASWHPGLHLARLWDALTHPGLYLG